MELSVELDLMRFRGFGLAVRWYLAVIFGQNCFIVLDERVSVASATITAAMTDKRPGCL